ncbi:LuxR family transcriptional regulator [Amycolatopsis sp. SID8362]|uniref:helix-turn-helix transcriptional regulator n=1 Tax=Amycolatopsis sp. SID8362 TaxID=2690346 RepID=UPI001371494A|nr:LuxR family transcriptional regulator [Amycolatopsis sp. SID8362]NBH10498.1 TrmB family transcriptional regulator [Amycolatopsis sp. SID8362]NED47192.1 TrmB family transcriptional regulator [Amycolatopsis sp. SID8362]
MLEALGMTPDEERVYRVVVGGYRSGPGEIAGKAGVHRREVDAILAVLLAKGLISKRGEHYVSAPPDVSLGPLLVHGQEQLEAARAAVSQLAEEYRASVRRRDSAQLVEVITGVDAIRRQALSIQRGAREESLWFCLEGNVAMAASENVEEALAQARGVQYRVIYETGLLEEPGRIANVLEGIEGGEIARSISKLPVRLAISDRKVALCPLVSHDSAGEPTAALVRESSLLSALVALFEVYWERASPLRIGDTAPSGHLDPDERRLLSLLISGVSDKSIATQLDVSYRTVQRRLQDLMRRVDVRTRMQLAWQASKLGWLDEPGPGHLLPRTGGRHPEPVGDAISS